jgi:hypothetical protein
MLRDLPAQIRSALAPLESTLGAAQLLPTSWEYSEKAFGNFAVVFQGSGRNFSLVRDRGQFMVSGPGRQELEGAGLWKAFDTTHELLPSLARWLRTSHGA